MRAFEVEKSCVFRAFKERVVRGPYKSRPRKPLFIITDKASDDGGKVEGVGVMTEALKMMN